MSLNADQISALQSLAESLKGTTLEDFVKSAAGQAVSHSKPPMPTAEDKAPAPSTIPQTQVLQDLAQVQSRAAPSVSVYLAPHTKNYIQRDVDTTKSRFIPTLLKFFYVLNCMDTVLSDNYYARRSLPHFYPSVTRLYYAVLVHYHVMRVMRYNKALNPEHAAFLEELETEFPPETLAIAAPLLPFFQAMTTSTPENKRLRRVYPAHHEDLLNDQDLDARMQSASDVDWFMPFIPMLARHHHELMAPFPGTLTLGADDSHSAGNKTVNYNPVPGYDYVVDLQHHPRSQYRRNYFPFPFRRAQDNTPNATVNANDLARITFFGQNQTGPIPNMENEAKRGMTKCGLAEPYNVHKDLTAQFKTNFSRIPVPEVETTDTFETMKAFFLMEDGMSWFSEIAAVMSAYATFFPGSGTMSDAKLEGPRTGQYVARIQAPAALPALPTFHGNEAVIHQFTASLITTVSEEEEITELLARYTQINTRMYGTHPWLPALGSAAHRNGPFWDVRPLYSHSTVDGSWIQTPQVIKSVALERPDKRV